MQKLKMPEGEPIEHPIVNRSIAKAQNRVESRNFDIRKQLLEYDDVANDQRTRHLPAAQRAARGDRRRARRSSNMVRGADRRRRCSRYIPPESIEEQWDVPGLETALAGRLSACRADVGTWVKADSETHRRDDARAHRRARASRSGSRRRRWPAPSCCGSSSAA